MMKHQFVCTNLIQQGNYLVCTNWQQLPEYSGYKLTHAEMGQFIFAIALLFATVASFKIVRSSFF